jgi:hypothetical protein
MLNRMHSPNIKIKFCVFLYKSPSEKLQMLEEAYDKAAMKKPQVYKWHKCFWLIHVTVFDAQGLAHYEFIPEGCTVNIASGLQ